MVRKETTTWRNKPENSQINPKPEQVWENHLQNNTRDSKVSQIFRFFNRLSPYAAFIFTLMQQKKHLAVPHCESLENVALTLCASVNFAEASR